MKKKSKGAYDLTSVAGAGAVSMAVDSSDVRSDRALMLALSLFSRSRAGDRLVCGLLPVPVPVPASVVTTKCRAKGTRVCWT